MIVAHRGASKHAHENTIEAFERAVALGADMVELDVRKTGDGVLVIFHDPVFPGAAARGALSRLTYRELQKRASARKFRVPTLEETLVALSGRIRLDIELKEPGYTGEVVALVKKRFDPAGCVFTAFDPRIAAEVKKADPALATGLILANAESLSLGDQTPADVLGPEKKLFASQRGYFVMAKKAGRKIAVWTVDGAPLLSSLLCDPIVDAVITNRPDRALALRKKLSGR
ncbi:MAG: glycerophosphodiester phosphodiesterase [Chitinispirillaceae bacterium]|nr:glycerophosphodiester phosphodiesterase [Chitinispirillaceae bacterium]